MTHLVLCALTLLLRVGKVKEIKKKKTKNTYAYQIMKKLVSGTKGWQVKCDDKKPKEANNVPKAENQLEAPVLIAAKRGVIEMVDEILEIDPSAIVETNSAGKNIVLLAAEYGQTRIYDKMLEIGEASLFGMVDNKGNSALHLAASNIQKRNWRIPGAAFQMQLEVKWFQYIKKSMEPGFFAQYNSEHLTPLKSFTRTHKGLMEDARKWLISTSQSCSVVAALIATAAYTSAISVPGGNNKNTGYPMFEGQPAFQVFAISSLVALCFSVTALIFFLSIVTSRFHMLDFVTKLPMKLIGGMSTLFVSIAANLISFCAGRFCNIHGNLESWVHLLYAVLSVPVMAFFFTSHLYVDLIRALFYREPERSKKPHSF